MPNLDAVPVGRTEFGQVCALKLAGTHHIVAAATGAGKSTLTWNVVRALGPGIASGLVRVTGLDPKGGMELYPGRPLFTFYEDDSPAAIADALDDVVLRMAQRKQRLRGASRDWSMSLEEPFELVIVDELAALTAYVPDRKLRERIAGSLQLVLSQGRALGFCVLACVQDPRKEILPFRDLYPTRIALRVTEDSHSNLTLGDGAKERGALCHLIREDTPGVGYLRLDGVAEPVRVRFGHVTDADIAAMAALWPAPPLGCPRPSRPSPPAFPTDPARSVRHVHQAQPDHARARLARRDRRWLGPLHDDDQDRRRAAVHRHHHDRHPASCSPSASASTPSRSPATGTPRSRSTSASP